MPSHRGVSLYRQQAVYLSNAGSLQIWPPLPVSVPWKSFPSVHNCILLVPESASDKQLHGMMYQGTIRSRQCTASSSPVKQTQIVISEAYRAHHSASPQTSLVAGVKTDHVWADHVKTTIVRINVKQLQFFCGELSFYLWYNFLRWKFLNSAELLPDALSILFKCEVHVIIYNILLNLVLLFLCVQCSICNTNNFDNMLS